MYNSNFSGIESDGQLHRMQTEMSQNPFLAQEASRRETEGQEISSEAARVDNNSANSRRTALSGLLPDGMKTDDLILIAIGILLMTDQNKDNDILIILIAILLFL